MPLPRPANPTRSSDANPFAQPEFGALAEHFSSALRNDVLPFWMRHSLDRECGGYFTCLTRNGSVFDTDKFVWLQARQVWTFSMLYQELERNTAWLDIARLGANFLLKYGRDPSGQWYFALDRQGRPLTEAYNIFSDCFAAMALGQYARVTGDAVARDVTLQTYQQLLARRQNPKGRFNKANPHTRPQRSLALPMILANVTCELEWLIGTNECNEVIARTVDEIFQFCVNPHSIPQEYIGADGQALDSFEGRLLNPGHTLEAMWFVIDVARRFTLPGVIEQAIAIILRTIALGWDEEFGGIFYFLDLKGYPPQQLEWDQKLWWVHAEALVAIAMALTECGKQGLAKEEKECLAWWRRLLDYTMTHFPDAEFGEWFGYLNRRGEVLLPLKGGKWKGCFHVPRALHLLSRECTQLNKKEWQ